MKLESTAPKQSQYEKLEQGKARLLQLHQADLGLEDLVPGSGVVAVPASSLYHPLVNCFPGLESETVRTI